MDVALNDKNDLVLYPESPGEGMVLLEFAIENCTCYEIPLCKVVSIKGRKGLVIMQEPGGA